MRIKTKSKESLKTLYSTFENLARKMGKEFNEQMSSKERETKTA